MCVCLTFTYRRYYCFSTEGERGTAKLPEQGHFRAWERYGAALKRSVENGSASLVCHSRFASTTCDRMMFSSRETVTSRRQTASSRINVVSFYEVRNIWAIQGRNLKTNGEKDWQFWRIHLFSKSHRIDSTLIRCIAVLIWRFKYDASLYTTPR